MKCPAPTCHEIPSGDAVIRGQNRVKNQFRQKFKRSLSQCARRGFSIEECFGLIWEEISEKIRLPEASQSELYDELIDWAKYRSTATISSARTEDTASTISA
jgi:hypothetical protein